MQEVKQYDTACILNLVMKTFINYTIHFKQKNIIFFEISMDYKTNINCNLYIYITY